MVDVLNRTWKPLLALFIVIGVFVAYVCVPIAYLLIDSLSNSKINFSIFEYINTLLLGGGILAGLRTIEKKVGALENTLEAKYKIERWLLNFNKWWRPLLVYEIVISIFIAYTVYPGVFIFGHTYVDFPAYYTHLNSLIITGGFLAGLKIVEKKDKLDKIH